MVRNCKHKFTTPIAEIADAHLIRFKAIACDSRADGAGAADLCDSGERKTGGDGAHTG